MKTINTAQKIWQIVQLALLVGTLVLLFFVVKGIVKKEHEACNDLPIQTENSYLPLRLCNLVA